MLTYHNSWSWIIETQKEQLYKIIYIKEHIETMQETSFIHNILETLFKFLLGVTKNHPATVSPGPVSQGHQIRLHALGGRDAWRLDSGTDLGSSIF